MIHRFDTLPSTNTYLKELAAQGAPQGTAVIAAHQTGGRGRLGRSFHSPAGSGIYLSWLLRPQGGASALMHLTCAVAVAMCDAVEKACGFRPGIKWTNDLVWGKRKLGGILTELGFEGGQAAWAVIGIGLNCTQAPGDFPPELQHMAASLQMAAGRPVDLQVLETAMLEALDAMASTLSDRRTMLDRYKKDCVTLGLQVSILRGDTVSHGTALDIDEEGALIVVHEDGSPETLSSGEVSVRGMYGYL